MINKIPKILSNSNESWPKFAAQELRSAVNQAILTNSKCSIMLTGGNTAKILYQEMAFLGDFPFEKITFFWGDERCVSPDHLDSNYLLGMSSLFPNGLINVAGIIRMEGDFLDRDEAAQRYEALLPNEIDVLLLGVGLDGHIASLFPGHRALNELERRVLPVYQIGAKHERITITPQVISSAKEVFLLATGRQKGKVLAKAMSSQIGYKEFPVCLTFGGTWLLDEDAAIEISLALK